MVKIIHFWFRKTHCLSLLLTSLGGSAVIGFRKYQTTNWPKFFQVRELVSECECPTQFPMVRVSEGKYRIGDTQTLIFVRVSCLFGPSAA